MRCIASEAHQSTNAVLAGGIALRLLRMDTPVVDSGHRETHHRLRLNFCTRLHQLANSPYDRAGDGIGGWCGDPCPAYTTYRGRVAGEHPACAKIEHD